MDRIVLMSNPVTTTTTKRTYWLRYVSGQGEFQAIKFTEADWHDGLVDVVREYDPGADSFQKVEEVEITLRSTTYTELG